MFTGSSTHTVLLPTTGVIAGMQYTIVNNSTGSVTVQSAKIDTPTAAADWLVKMLYGSMVAVSQSTAIRDSNANLTADNFIATRTSTTTAAGTTTLTIDSAQVQVFTGSTTQNVDLPTTSVVAGQSYIIVNNSTGVVTVRSSAGNTISNMPSLRAGIFVARIDTPTGSGDWHFWPITASAASVAYSLAMRDGVGNLTADNFIATKTSTATAAGTTTLTVDSTQIQEFTGSTTQTVLLPTTSIVAGQRYTIVNNSSGAVTVQSSGANAVYTVNPARIVTFVARVDTPTGAGDWYVSNDSGSQSATSYSTALRDGNANIYSDNFIATATSTATAAGTATANRAGVVPVLPPAPGTGGAATAHNAAIVVHNGLTRSISARVAASATASASLLSTKLFRVFPQCSDPSQGVTQLRVGRSLAADDALQTGERSSLEHALKTQPSEFDLSVCLIEVGPVKELVSESHCHSFRS